MIRSATHEDIPRIIEMAQAFYATTNYPSIAPMPDEQAAGIIIITIKSGVMLVAETEGELVGMICIHVDAFIFNPAVQFPNELAFWVEPEHRGSTTAMRLVRSAEEALRVLGVPVSRLARLPNSQESLDGFYEVMGYKPDESYVIKRLN